jgi:hypothetical protein
MDVKLFNYSPIVERAPLRWPEGARVAFYVGLNVEHYQVERPSARRHGRTRPGYKYLDQALEYVENQAGVWLTTSDEIEAHYELVAR